MIANQLILRLTEQEAEWHAEWAVLAHGEIASISDDSVTLPALSQLLPPGSPDRRVTVLVPGHYVGMLHADIPARQRRQLGTTLPYIVEDAIADDVAHMHFAAGRDDENGLPVAAIRADMLRGLLQALDDIGISPDILMPDILAVPPNPQGWTLVYDGHTGWLRTGACSGGAMETAMLPTLIDLHLAHLPPETSLRCHLTPNLPQDDPVLRMLFHTRDLRPDSIHLQTLATTPFRLFCGQAAGAPALNMLQGGFAPIHRRTASMRGWQKIAAMAAAWFVGAVVLNGMQAAYYLHASHQLETAQIALYHAVYPQDTNIVDPLRQMQRHISHATRQSNPAGFLALLGTTAAHWPAAEPAPTIQDISYDSTAKRLTMNIKGPQISMLNDTVQRLSAPGIDAKLLSVVAAKDGASSQLSIGRTP